MCATSPSSPELPRGFTLSVLAPRNRLKAVNTVFAKHLETLLPVSPTIGKVKSTSQEWSSSALLAIEIPMLDLGKNGNQMSLQRLLIQHLSLGKHAALIIEPRMLS